VSQIWVRTAFYWQVAVVFSATAGFDCVLRFTVGTFKRPPHTFPLALMSALVASLTSGSISLFWKRSFQEKLRLIELHRQTRSLLESRIRSALQVLATMADKYETHPDHERRNNAMLVKEQVRYINRRIQFDTSALLYEDLEHLAKNPPLKRSSLECVN
jgi:hypothetical protein